MKSQKKINKQWKKRNLEEKKQGQKQNLSLPAKYTQTIRLLSAVGLSILLLSGCSQVMQEQSEKKEMPIVSTAENPKSEETPTSEETKQSEAKKEETSQNSAEKQNESKKDDILKEEDTKKEEGIKDSKNVPVDTPDNISEQRKMVFPDVDIRLTLPTELAEKLKDIDFTAFGLDPANPQQIQEIDSPYVLANKANYFPEDYKPKDLVVPDIPFSFSGENEKKYLQRPAADALTSLINGASAEGIAISGVSGYRSIARQKIIYKYNVDTYGQSHADQYSAKPRYSEHHTGLCMDVSSASVNFDLVEKYGDTKEGKWLAQNAHKYGFVIRYPKGKENITGYSYEPWHIRYLGVDLASYLYVNELAYEEFVAGMQKIMMENRESMQDPAPVSEQQESLNPEELENNANNNNDEARNEDSLQPENKSAE